MTEIFNVLKHTWTYYSTYICDVKRQENVRNMGKEMTTSKIEINVTFVHKFYLNCLYFAGPFIEFDTVNCKATENMQQQLNNKSKSNDHNMA